MSGMQLGLLAAFFWLIIARRSIGANVKKALTESRNNQFGFGWTSLSVLIAILYGLIFRPYY